MTETPLTPKDIEEAFGRVDWEKALNDEIIKEHAEEYKRHYDHHMMTTLYGSSFADMIMINPKTYKYLTRKSHKKIKRKLYYDVYFYYGVERQSHYFESAKKMRKFVNNIHELVSCDIPGVRIEKTFCYRQHSPRHKTYYVSFRPNQFIVVEKY